jgi:hypothetical protein
MHIFNKNLIFDNYYSFLKLLIILIVKKRKLNGGLVGYNL